ncbi:MAG: 16S rRNA (cytosine(1402)-N(4))-methyltransferase RsmH [Luteitalea sp.]|nr:16S rRNA (cytosine(1402)-N(4))-methyltransferase RsmH [Luteitalea sp.]
MLAHEPVMVAEVVARLAAAQGGRFVDCTVGAGGHSRALLEAGAARIIGLDRDLEALAVAEATLAPWASQVELVHADFRELGDVLRRRAVATVDGVLADLGLSSMQVDAEGRGFSFRRDEPLDMRMDRTSGPDAATLVARASERELADVIYRYGEERYARRIARAIVSARARGPIETTGQLAAIVRRVVWRSGGRIDPATRTFQAVRIWVNAELEGLDRFLREAVSWLRPQGRLVAIAFHSLEDRIVKQTLRQLATDPPRQVALLTKRPVMPDDEEVTRNPRARSAKLRAAERLGRLQGEGPEGASLRSPA